MFIAGMRGTAKSSTAASIAMLYNPKFSMKNWAFTTEEWMEKTKEAERGDVVVFDEQGTQKSGSSQKWQKTENQELADEVQLNRTDGVVSIGISIESSRLINRVRNTYKVIVYPETKLSNVETGGNGLAVDCIFRFINENPFANNDKDRFIPKYFNYTKGGRITRFRIPHPPALFWNEYSVRRSEVREKIRFASRNKAAPPNKESKNKTSPKEASGYFGEKYGNV